MSEIQLQITGMTCSACSARIEKVLRRLEDVQEAFVSEATSTATVRLNGKSADVERIIHRIEQLGYGAERKEQAASNPFITEAHAWRGRFIASFFLSLPLFAAMLGHSIEALNTRLPAFLFEPSYQLIIGTLLFFYGGYPFLIGAYKACRQWVPNMDVLIALSMTSAYLYSGYQAIHLLRTTPIGHEMGHLYFDAIAMIATAITLGKWLEAIAKGNAHRTLSALYELQPQAGRVLRSRTEVEFVPVERIEPGSLVIVAAGEWLPADGRVEEGIGEVDESLLTGESIAIVKRPGDTLYAGTRLISGEITMTTTARSSESRLSRLIGFVAHAQAIKPRIQRMADRTAAYFVPAIVGLAVLTYLYWSYSASPAEAFGIAMAVLLVACPCALGLATPISILIGSSNAVKSGIVFKEGSMVETLSRVDLYLFDKTGTLTTGKPNLYDIRSNRMPSMKLLRLSASLEKYSEHPLAKVVVREALSKRLLLSAAQDVKEYPGEGISGIVENHSVELGSERWLIGRGVVLSATEVARIEEEHASVLHVAIDGRWSGVLLFRDSARADARHTVSMLCRHASIAMASGDRTSAAKQIADETGINEVHAQLLPEQKLELIQQFQRSGYTVAMVGDGINDAAALAAADVGIVIAGANEAAIHAGDVVILESKLAKISEATSIARRTMRNIKQNFGIAILYNLVMIPLAIFGSLDPRAACIGMACSSLSVVGNALRLKRSQISPGLRGNKA